LVAGDDYGGLCAWVGVCEPVGLFIDLVAAKGSTSVLILAALVAGLGMGVLPQLVLVVPGAFGLLLLRCRGLEIKSSPRQLGLPLVAFAIGASTFLYLPLRATMQPRANWGDPVTFERFWQLVTAQQYHHLAQGVAVEGWLARLGAGMVQVSEQLGYLGLLPTLVGASLLWYKNRGGLGYLLSLISLTLLFRTSYPAEGNLVYLMPALYAMALLMGVGLASGLTIVQSRHGNRALALLTLLLVALFSWRTITIAPQQDLSHDYSATLFAEELLSTLPPNAIIVSERDESTFSLWYQQALGQRQDIVVIDSRLLFYDWYQHNLRHHHPDLNPTALRPGGLTALARPVYMLTEPVEKRWMAKHIKP
jgi:hypothetical protein